MFNIATPLVSIWPPVSIMGAGYSRPVIPPALLVGFFLFLPIITSRPFAIVFYAEIFAKCIETFYRDWAWFSDKRKVKCKIRHKNVLTAADRSWLIGPMAYSVICINAFQMFNSAMHVENIFRNVFCKQRTAGTNCVKMQAVTVAWNCNALSLKFS